MTHKKIAINKCKTFRWQAGHTWLLSWLLILTTFIAACGQPGEAGDRPSQNDSVTRQTSMTKESGSTDRDQSGSETDEAATVDAGTDIAAYDGPVVDVLTLAGGTDWGPPNPYQHASRGPGQAKMRLIFASLLEADEHGPVGWMAENWDADDTVFTFYLHETAAFHDGTPLTSEDVLFSIDYQRQHPPVSGSLGYADSFIVKDATAIDAHTIRIETTSVDANTLTALGSFIILPRHIWQDIDDPVQADGPGIFIGSGAYQFEAYEASSGSYAFRAVNDFCAGTPAAERILFVPVSDELLAFEQGQISIASMPPDLSDRYLDRADIGYVEKSNDFGYKLLIHFERFPQFLDLEKREALYQAINRQKIVDDVFRGLGEVGSAGYAPAGSIFYNPDVATYQYKPEQARETLAPLDLEMTLLAGNSGDDVKIAELLKLDLEAAGIEIEVIAYDAAVRDDRINEGQYDLALVGNGGWGGRAPAYLRTIFSDVSKNQGGNPHFMGPVGYSHALITELAEAQALETDLDKRITLFKDLQMAISEEIPLITLATRSIYSIYRKQEYDGWMKTYDYQQAEQNRLSYMVR